ncbi:MAG: hypothetical protein EOP45_13335, partial [Sphingobacteriaceae bacterium]
MANTLEANRLIVSINANLTLCENLYEEEDDLVIDYIEYLRTAKKELVTRIIELLGEEDDVPEDFVKQLQTINDRIAAVYEVDNGRKRRYDEVVNDGNMTAPQQTILGTAAMPAGVQQEVRYINQRTNPDRELLPEGFAAGGPVENNETQQVKARFLEYLAAFDVDSRKQALEALDVLYPLPKSMYTLADAKYSTIWQFVNI